MAGFLSAVLNTGTVSPAPYASTGALTASPFPRYSSTAALSGSSVLDFQLFPITTSTPGFTGPGALTAILKPILPSSAALSGSGSLSATAIPQASVAAPDTGTGTLSATVSGTVNNVAFDTIGGALAESDFTSTSTYSFTHSASGSRIAVIVMVEFYQYTGSTNGTTRSVKYGGIPMPSLGVVGTNNMDVGADGGFIEFFGLLNAAAGSKTVSVTLSSTSNPIYLYGRAQSSSYTGVVNWGLASYVTGTETGTALSQTVNAPNSHDMVIQGFICLGSPGPIGSYNKSMWYSQPSATFCPMATCGYAQGPSPTFTATRPSGVDYGGVGLRLSVT